MQEKLTRNEYNYALKKFDKYNKEQQRYLFLEYQRLEKKDCSENIEYYIENYVNIEDRDSETLAVLFHLWDGQKKALEGFVNNRLNIVLKARQLGLSWLALAYANHEIVFKSGYQAVVLSKREDEAKELIRRTCFILRHLPSWLIINQKDLKEGYKGLYWDNTALSVTIYHPNSEPSVFISMSAAPDSGRSFTANLVILDEWAFQQWATEIWSSAYPTINRPSGGKVIGLSTAKRMTLFEEIWRKAKLGINTFNTIFLNWRTDPRRTDEWYEQTKKDLPLSYKAEYPNTEEEAFMSAEGVAFEEFSESIHVCKPFEIPDYWVKWRSVDNGYTDPFAWYWFAVDGDGVVYCYREYTRDPVKDEKLIYSDQAKRVVVLTGKEHVSFTVAGHDAWNVHHLSKNAENPQGKSIIDYYQEGGVRNCVKAITDRALRKATLHEYLKPYFDGNINKTVAKVQIFNTCTKLIETLPQLINDEKDSEKVAECAIDHWFDSFGYGLIAYHAKRSELDVKVDLGKLPQDYQEDYYNSDEATQKMLLQRWGIA